MLAPNYFQYFAILSQASFFLLQDSISEQELQQCERLLEYYCLMFVYLCELRYQTINIHNLLHLPQSVRELGPLWTHSCFHFEDKNGYILKMIHGTQNVSSQIVPAVSFVQNLPQMVQSLQKIILTPSISITILLERKIAVNRLKSCTTRMHLVLVLRGNLMKMNLLL